MHTHKPPQPVCEYVYTGLEIESVRRSRGKIIVMEYGIGGNLKKMQLAGKIYHVHVPIVYFAFLYCTCADMLHVIDIN